MNIRFLKQKPFNYIVSKKFVLKVWLLFVLLFCSSLSYSQSWYFNAGTSISKLDLSINNINGYTETQFKAPLLSYMFSGGVEYFEHKFFSISSDLYLYQTGGKYSKDEVNTQHVFNFDHSVEATYLSVGSSFNFIPLDKKLKLQISVGPRIDFFLSTGKYSPYRSWDLNRNGLTKVNYGITSGIGLYYKMNKCEVGIKMQYLGKSKKVVEADHTNNPQIPLIGTDAKEHTFVTALSIKFPLRLSGL